MGDFNAILSKIGKCGKEVKITNFANRLKANVVELEICEIYRILHPENKIYTWRKCTIKA